MKPHTSVHSSAILAGPRSREGPRGKECFALLNAHCWHCSFASLHRQLVPLILPATRSTFSSTTPVRAAGTKLRPFENVESAVFAILRDARREH